MSLTYLTYKEIDKNKWDECIQKSVNGLIYAESAYLDHMSANWDAIILNDYEAVMPLTWKRKWNIRYLYQPAFVQQGGIFFKKKLNDNLLEDFINEAFARFRFAEININFLNLIDWKQSTIEISSRNNYILRLGEGYKQISAGYKTYINQRLNRLQKFSLQYKHSTDFATVINLYKSLYNDRIGLASQDYLQFENLCKFFFKKSQVITRHIYNNDGVELLASVVLLKDEKRLYNIISCLMPRGKKLLANYFLYNELTREFADEDIILDFEGSDIPGVSYFYEKFSDSNQQYAFLKFNRLPLPVRLLKR